MPAGRLKALPRRLILSRKGWDSTWGGAPSPILDGYPFSLPIPEHATARQHRDCRAGHVRFSHLPEAVQPFLRHWRTTDGCVHLDPDLRPALRPTGASGEQLLFGQEGLAQIHLEKQGVAAALDRSPGGGDVFLFFGWFRNPLGEHQHVLWGWFEVAAAIDVTSAAIAESLAHAAHHPHVSHWQGSLQRPGRRNRLYLAPSRASFADGVPGAGIFPYTPAHVLTAPGATRSVWRLPRVLAELGMTFHERQLAEAIHDRRRRTVDLRSAPIGQEFVIPPRRAEAEIPDLRRCGVRQRRELSAWIEALFEKV